MTLNTELPKIDRYTCNFENPVLEAKYREQKWNKHKKLFDGLLIFMAIMVLIDIPLLYQTRGSLFPMIIVSPIYAGLIILFRFSGEQIRIKYYQLFIAIVFSTFHAYQVQLAIGGSGFEATPRELLALEYSFNPILYIFLLLLLPLRFVLAVGMALFFTIASLPVTMMQLDGHYQYLFSGVVLPFIILGWNKWRTEINERRDYSMTVSMDETRTLMHQTLQRYFGEVLSDKILTHKGDLRGENRWVTLTFTDIASYSTILERMSPSIAVEFLNEYFTAMHEIISEHNGQILNYIGDAVMVVYGAPQDLRDHEMLAVQCAIKMRERLDELNLHWETSKLSRYWKNNGIEKIVARTGLHTGNAITGNIGSDQMLQYSAIGDVVNVAARLEQANKQFGTTIAFSEEIRTALEEELYERAEFMGEIQLKGREVATRVYSI